MGRITPKDLQKRGISIIESVGKIGARNEIIKGRGAMDRMAKVR